MLCLSFYCWWPAFFLNCVVARAHTLSLTHSALEREDTQTTIDPMEMANILRHGCSRLTLEFILAGWYRVKFWFMKRGGGGGLEQKGCGSTEEGTKVSLAVKNLFFNPTRLNVLHDNGRFLLFCHPQAPLTEPLVSLHPSTQLKRWPSLWPRPSSWP